MFRTKTQITAASTAVRNKQHGSLSDCANTVSDFQHVGVTKDFAGGENLLCISKNKTKKKRKTLLIEIS
jgi:hypothetical protein